MAKKASGQQAGRPPQVLCTCTQGSALCPVLLQLSRPAADFWCKNRPKSSERGRFWGD
eukprot:NODE_9095_length_488_cov_5.328018_g8020_i0.p3 GENE.NODE_9095_length_488_cov_5.328018_g8020_i0~~NODE_9095_length_488_cov_5.328018_g8020_i0.p3  ORF type:complete len:58 (-),score=0.77 NODE_9095_length_488_cov_5.328018_g8020_i0:54-227(-)